MKTDRLLWLLAAALVLVGAAVWVQRIREARRAPAAEVGSPVVAALQKPETLNAVAEIAVLRADSTVRIARTEAGWTAPDRHGHPVKAEEVRKFLLTLSDLKVGQSVPGGEEIRESLDLLEPAIDTNGQPRKGSSVLVVLSDSNRAELARVILGKERRRGGETGFADGRFVWADGRPALVGETFSTLPSRSVDWMNTQLVDLFSSDIDALDWTPAGKPTMSLTNLTGELRLCDLATNEAMDSVKVSRLTGIVSWLRFADVANPSLDAGQTGLDQPSVLVARARNGRVFTVKIGAAAGTNAQRHVAVSAAFTPRPLPEPPAADASEEAKKKHEEEAKNVKADNEKIESEIRELNERCSKWVYLVDSSRFDNLPETRADLLQPPPAPPAPAATATNAAPADSVTATNAPVDSTNAPAAAPTGG